eukprot:gb/GECG01005688.1/.p1 GENE.gb/GECG01005688.1/~~gb/GECG01005688.1/.p1  ORF type:complete len:319 (+),score=41.84 gb/GECG01005688.1/:1-957(+)
MPSPQYRNHLPQLKGNFFMADGGIETTLLFLYKLDLPYFAAFHLLGTEEGQEALRRYFRTYAQLAQKFGTGLVLETPTWRASRDYGRKLGYTEASLADANKQAVDLVEQVRSECEEGCPIVVSGCIGPRGDGYAPGEEMSIAQAKEYHQLQVEAFSDSAADVVCAMTMNYVNEAVGIVQAAKQMEVPVVISFTVETDGKLPTGATLGDAIKQVDEATDGYTSYFMINCAHPTHFDHSIVGNEQWGRRICGLRANASKMTHEELDEASELDVGDPEELGRDYARLRQDKLKCMNVMGGCCGTDERHIDQIARSCLSLFN